jgi:NAD(P)-dependent dehydrogenase (short-subunit alcohol dehydrogenase family)
VRRLALVTGGCRRLGAAIAARLAKDGWDLALHAGHAAVPEPGLAAAAAPVEVTCFEADFTDPAAAEALFADVAARCRRSPSLLVNAAATFGQDRLEDVTASSLLDQYAVNCAAPALLTRAFAAAGGEGDRSIVNILDQRIAAPHGDQIAYTLSKVALAGLTRIAARELAPAVRVNAVAPGLTIPGPEYEAAGLDRLAAMMPLARLPQPAEVADAVAWLAGARATTGQILFVDGGAGLESWKRDFANL